MANVNFIQGSAANFLALATKDTNTLYFLDNGQLYKGWSIKHSVCKSFW